MKFLSHLSAFKNKKRVDAAINHVENFRRSWGALILPVTNVKKKHMDGYALNDLDKTDVSRFETVTRPGYLSEKFKKLVNNADVQYVYDKYLDLVSDQSIPLGEEVLQGLGSVVAMMPIDEALSLLYYAAEHKVAGHAIRNGDGCSAFLRHISLGIEAAQPADRIKFLAAIDNISGMNQFVSKAGTASLTHNFIISAVSGLETQDAIQALLRSQSWANYRELSHAAEFIQERDSRLIPAFYR